MIQVGMHFDAAAGGADRYFRGLLSGLDAASVPYTAVAFGPESEATAPPGERMPLGPVSSSLVSRLKRLHDFAREAMNRQPPLLVSHFALYALPFLTRWGRKTPHLVHFHGPWAGEAAAEGAPPWVVAAKRLLETRVYATASRVIVLSDAFGQLLARDYGVARERITVIPGGVDLERFRPPGGEGDRGELRRRLGWPENRRVIFCVRRMTQRMGLEELLAAFAAVRARHPDLLLVLGGRGNLADTLRQAAAPLGDSVFFPGFIPDELLPQAYAAADFTVVPSQALEGFGLVTLEALACGTPVLVTPVGGLPEAVRGLDPALVLPGCDAGALEAGLERGLSGALPDAAACRNYAEAFGWEAIARRVNAVYRECAQAGRAR